MSNDITPQPATAPVESGKPRRRTLFQGIAALILTVVPILLTLVAILISSGEDQNAMAPQTLFNILIITGPVLTIIGIIMGHVALLKPIQGSRVPAIIALILGYGGTLAIIALFGSFFIFMSMWHD